MLDKSKLMLLLGDCASQFEIFVFDQVESTNDIIKFAAEQGGAAGMVAIASSQTKGRGRRGHRFCSPEGGLYLSLLLRPAAADWEASHITCAAAVAVCDAVEELCGKEAGIKWVNDIFINGKKVCGILTESKLNSHIAKLEYAVLGIGINVYKPIHGFPEEIEDIACAMFEESSADILEKTAAALLRRLALLLSDNNVDFIYKYIEKSCVIGKKINVIRADERIPARAIGIVDGCRLLVEYNDGACEALSSGEISIREI